MSFWNKNRLSNETKQQYSELLIELVELNEDKQWLEYFHNLRLGHDLPGGGMGSLNDWSPSYKDDIEYAWFNLLYGITHKLLTEKLESEFIKDDYSIKHRNEANILKCPNCEQKFQHPRIFENHIATFYYFKNFSKFIKQNMLKDFTNPNFSYKNLVAIQLRQSLESEYEKNDIILFDFIKHKYNCSKCDKKMDFEHIDFKIDEKENKLELKKIKPVANNV
jgi:uncharacterized C2H2 Zn-finger protein